MTPGQMINQLIILREQITDRKYMECVMAHMKLAPTIIEADKGGDNK